MPYALLGVILALFVVMVLVVLARARQQGVGRTSPRPHTRRRQDTSSPYTSTS